MNWSLGLGLSGRLLAQVMAGLLLCLFSLGLTEAVAQNAIMTENARPGNPASEWDITNGAGDAGLQGFATDISYNRGTRARFKIKTNAAAYSINIYRLGYYQGNGARFIGTAAVSASLPQNQPTCLTDPTTGLVDCGNWSESAFWDIPATAVSGIYIAKLTRATGSSHIAFIVRDDASTADLLFQTSDATWQAYNVYGDTPTNGKSFYTGVSGSKASKISYNRPFATRSGGGGGGNEDWLFNAEYPMIRFLEKNGYDVTYTTNVDTERRGNLIQNHKAFLSVGHDEYWSKGMRDNVTAARNAGKHLAFFSGNEVYWKTRWENSIDGSGATHRTLVCYKEGSQGENQCNGKCDPSPEWTGLWRSGCEFPGSGGCDPENALTGQISWAGSNTALQVPDTYKNLRFWRNTSVASLPAGQTATFTPNTVGYEWSPEQETYRASYPAGRIILSRTVLGGQTHHLSLYKHSSGALVFGAGSVQWSWGLDSSHDRGSDAPSRDMQQATVNLLADMGAQPGSRQTDLAAATASTDTQAPSVTITSPLNGSTLPGGAITIRGTAADANTVAGVEVSTDGGSTWRLATGTTSWSYAWTPATAGAASIRSRAFDDSGNLSAVTTVTVNAPGQVCPCTVFQATEAPTGALISGQPVQLGMKFRAASDGYITGVRFYKQSGNTGTHTGQLYSSSGTLLATAVFNNETASGWQEAAFAAPVAISANTTYIISYHSGAGFYSFSNPYFNVAKVNGPIRALASGEDGGQAVYNYAATPTFPSLNFETSNYWIDAVFNTSLGNDTTPPTITATAPANNAADVNISGGISVTFSEAISSASLSSSTFRLLRGGTAVPATLTNDASSRTATLVPTSPLSYGTTYTVEVRGGSTDPRITDLSGNALAATTTWSFTTRPSPPPVTSPNDGPGGPILVISAAGNPFSRYAVEILRAEGFNEFAARDITEVSANPGLLNSYDVIILGEVPVTAANVTALTNWVNAGGTLVAFKPAAALAPLLGITPAAGTLADRYLLVNTGSGPGAGIVSETMQFHGAANLYTLNGATALATLYSSATAATANPAVTTRNVGTNGGQAIAFTYDLARSIVYTRQGNPAYAGQKRDGEQQPIRSDDLFYPDYVDLNKVTIPQADEQQRLLANIILQGNMDRKPLPRFWYLPRGLKAAVVMTGDDHGVGGTKGRFDQYISLSSSNTPDAVANWTAIRSTSYIYPGTPITNAQALAYEAQGFEIGLHVNTDCAVWTPAALRNYFSNQMAQLRAQLPGLSPILTNRTHCISWSDWATKPKVELENGMRLDVNYYYWPAAWIQDRPGMFTGSGIPMRFADLDGSLIDVYQAATQLTDESGITYSTHINTLLDNAIGAKGFYGVFTANMHTDINGANSSNGSDAIIASARQRQIPVISAKQMLTWLDGRNNSSFGAMTWSGNALNFSIATAEGSFNLRAMLPINAAGGQLTALTVNGSPVTYTSEMIKGMLYAFFPATNGTYVATYGTDAAAPQINTVAAAPTTAGGATITWITNEASNSRVNYGTAPTALSANVADAALVNNHSITLPGLAPGTTYYYRVQSTDGAGNTTVSPAAATAPLSFTTPALACFTDQDLANFSAGTAGSSTYATAAGVMLKPQVAEEFTSLPPATQWQGFPWNIIAPGGTSTVTGGQVVVNGSRYNTEPATATFGPGTSIEFVATFNATQHQHIGFGAGGDAAPNEMFNSTPWAMFSTGLAGTGLQARVNGGTPVDVNIPGSFLAAPHRYRIDWQPNAFVFYIDGNLVHTQAIALTTPMRVAVSDLQPGGLDLSMDWITIGPYAASGSFTSRVYDGGGAKTWQEASWQADVPAGTSLALFQRQGNTPSPDGTWSAFTAISANGAKVGGTSRYIQYRADLSGNGSATPLLQNVSIGCSAPVTCPALAFTPASGAALPAAIVQEPYSQAVTSAPNGYAFVATGLPAGLTMNAATGLISGTPTVSGSFPISVTATQGSCTVTASYTLAVSSSSAVACFDDQTPADFGAGAPGSNTYVTAAGLTLKPLVAEEFTSLPAAALWQGFPWVAGGTSTVTGGQVVVNGSRFNNEPLGATFAPGSSVEFVATFNATPYQHIGFAAGDNATMYNTNSNWAMFSTGTGGTVLQARTANGGPSTDVNIPGITLGVPHRYRIDWKTGSIAFFVDGALVHTQAATLTAPMRVGISDFEVTAPSLSCDWVNVYPYTASGSFTSRVYDGGSAKTWQQASWQADVPAGTTLVLFQRQGNTPTPDATWTTFTAISASGAQVGGTSRYIQYRADLASADGSATPLLRNVSFGCAAPVCPTVVFAPASGAVLTAAVVGTPYSQSVTAAPNGYTFAATGLPAGLSMNPASGLISGTPTAAITNATITVTATQGNCTRTASYTLTVTAGNNAPVLAAIGNPAPVAELTTLSFTAAATDDGGAAALTYSLVGAPTGATIGDKTGAFSWAPTEAQGPNTYTFTVRVSDGVLSDQEEITVTVNEVNVAPVLAAIGARNVMAQMDLSFSAAATDADLPANTLTYSLAGTVPAGAVIGAASGVFSWTPTSAQVGTHSFMVRVTDNGIPAQVDEELISVTVVPVATGPQVLSFTLINAGTDQVIKTITEGEVLNLATLPTRNLNIRADIGSVTTRSVVFSLSGRESKSGTESTAPYSLFGDNSGNYNSWTPAVGSYTLIATAYSSTSGQGTAGQPYTINFAVVNQTSPVVYYTLNTAVTGSGTVSRSPEVDSYASGSQVRLTASPAQGYKFDGWSGGAQGATNPLTVTMTRNLSITASFSLLPEPTPGPQVLSFSLINASTDQVIKTIVEGEALNLATLPTRNLNIRANTNPATTGSVVFSLTGRQSKSVTESTAPYALFGDNNGNYNSWTPTVGSYALRATAYSSANGRGTAGQPYVVNFTVLNQAAVASRVEMPQQAAAPMAATLRAYPNPSGNGQFKVQQGEAWTGEVTYTLLSAVGTKLASGKMSLASPSAEIAFDFSRQMPAAGVYYLHLENNKTKAVLKLMRQ